MKSVQKITLFIVMVLVSSLAGCGGGNNGPNTSVPNAPNELTIASENNQLIVSWTEVSGATGYEVWYHTANNSSAATQFTGDSNTADTTCTITGLTNGTPFYVWVKAKNSAGTSGFSQSISGKPGAPISPPDAPAAPTLVAGNQQLVLTWRAVTGATGYEVWYHTANNSSGATQFNGDSNTADTTCTITGLTNGTTYYVWVKAKNSVGPSGFSPSGNAAPSQTTIGKSLYVAPNGSDTYTREQNDINHPWASPAKAWLNAQAGDVVNFRAGIYTVIEQIDQKYKGNDGTEANPIVFQSYPGEIATIQGGSAFDQYNPVFRIERDWYIVRNLKFTGGYTMFQIGYNSSVNGGLYENCECSGYKGGDNVGFVMVYGSNITIKNCKIVGPGTTADIHNNTSCIIAFNARGLKILNCDLSNVRRGIYFKHGHKLTTDTGIEIAYNHIHDTGHESFFTNSYYARIHDNLIGANNKDCVINSDNGGANGDHNIITHNTFFNVKLIWDEDLGGSQYNTFKDNLFTQMGEIHIYSAVPHYSTLDYNLYPTGNVIQEHQTSYTLAAWKNYYHQDAHSLSGTPTFTNRSGAMNQISDFALQTGSIGKHAASDGKDIGADISKVGILQ